MLPSSAMREEILVLKGCKILREVPVTLNT